MWFLLFAACSGSNEDTDVPVEVSDLLRWTGLNGPPTECVAGTVGAGFDDELRALGEDGFSIAATWLQTSGGLTYVAYRTDGAPPRATFVSQTVGQGLDAGGQAIADLDMAVVGFDWNEQNDYMMIGQERPDQGSEVRIDQIATSSLGPTVREHGNAGRRVRGAVYNSAGVTLVTQAAGELELESRILPEVVTADLQRTLRGLSEDGFVLQAIPWTGSRNLLAQRSEAAVYRGQVDTEVPLGELEDHVESLCNEGFVVRAVDQSPSQGGHAIVFAQAEL